jgi:YbgC/YbaW family acyl-CoA thioester hydrolase
MRGVRSTREYVLTRAGDAVPVARGRAEWIYIDTKTAQPIRCPDEWAATYPAVDQLEDLGVAVGTRAPAEGAHRSASRRRVRFHELDGAQHVNHAVYLRWVEEAAFDAFRVAGPPGTLRLEGHEIQYFASAVADDNVSVVGWLSEREGAQLVWTCELSNADTGKLLARDYSLWSFVDGAGRPTVPPAAVIDNLLRGPTA